mmetsp:Transcript_42494/g.117618  ORF Transcript_42494/g.117618 Transcript_42494/m.117618 type:complete len:403 (-) Transcript_42494:212-1420(-)
MPPRLRVYVGTWNMHGKDPPESLAPWLPGTPSSSGGGGPAAQFDMYVIGTQEAERSIEKSVLNPSKAKWLLRLNAELGDGFVCVASHSLVAIHLAVYVRRGLLAEVSGVQSAHVACGLGDILGNKGGVGISLRVGRTSMLCVNAHFAAHQTKIAERNADFHRINSALGLRPSADGAASSSSAAAAASASAGASASSPTSSAGAAHAAGGCAGLFDRVIWCGDLNYRIAGCRAAIDAVLEPPGERARAAPEWGGEDHHWDSMRAVLLGNDQLRQQMAAGNVFNGFEEGDITFRPTYKFDSKQRHLYDQSEKQRVPAYTDRVLFRAADAAPPGAVRLLQYSSSPELTTSDHRPVFAELAVAYEPSAAAADADAVAEYSMPMVSRSARSGTTPAAQSQSSVCAVM